MTLVLLCAAPAHAAGAEAAGPVEASEVPPDLSAREYLGLAEQWFQQHEYLRAAHALEAAYQRRPLPRVLFDIGQAYRAAGRPAEAIAAYQRFVHAIPDSPLASEARVYIELQRVRMQQAEPANLPEPPPAPLAPAVEASPALPPARAPDRPRHGPLWWPGWAALSAGALGVATGGALWAVDGRRTCPTAPLCAQELDSRGAGIAVLASGGALLVSGVVLLVLDTRGAATRRLRHEH